MVRVTITFNEVPSSARDRAQRRAHEAFVRETPSTMPVEVYAVHCYSTFPRNLGSQSEIWHSFSQKT